MKDELRKEYLLIRKNIKNKQEKSLIITKRVINTYEYKNAKTIGIYISLDNEVDTNELIKYSIKIGKKIVIPRVCDDNLIFYRYKLDDILVKSKFGVLEPIDDKNKIVNANDIDLMIIPGVCFDREKNRLGFGKGYYDRYLNNNVKKMAICFEEQVLDKELLPVDKYDKKMDIIITDKNIY